VTPATLAARMPLDYLFVFMVGCILGSFLNVCIYRLPRGESIVAPASHCPKCNQKIRPLDNIPVLSFLLLRGKCRHCLQRISPRYPLVEVLTGILFVLFFARAGWSVDFVRFTVLASILIPVAFIDLEYKLILNVFTLPGMVFGLVLQLLLNPARWQQPVIGILAGAGFIYLVRLVGNLLLKQESMGLGDVKLAAMIGAFLGPRVVLVLLLAFFIAAPVAAVVMAVHRFQARREIPFGPFIVAATIVFTLAGDQLLKAYLRLLGY